MKLTVIGCYGGYPAAGEASSGYLIQHEGFNLLIDCGSAVLSKLQQYIKIGELNALVVSHYHYDHTADIGPLLYGKMINSKIEGMKEPLVIYGHNHDEKAFSMLSLEPYVISKPYNGNEELKLGPFILNFCETVHPVKCFAIKISDGKNNIVYTADTSYFEGLVDFSKEADLIVCECNLYKGQDGSSLGHLSSIDAGLLADKSKAGHLLLTHLPHFGSVTDLAKEAGSVYNGNISIASFGWNFELN